MRQRQQENADGGDEREPTRHGWARDLVTAGEVNYASRDERQDDEGCENMRHERATA